MILGASQRSVAQISGNVLSSSFRAARITLARLAVVVVFVILWQVASESIASPFWIGRPTDIANVIKGLAESGSLWIHLSQTIQEMILGLVIGIAVGGVIGIILGLYAPLAAVVKPFIQGVYAVPKLALAPLFILWFGIGLQSKVILTVTIVFFLVFWNTYAGVLNVDQELVDVVRVMGAKRIFLVLRIILPSAMDSMFTGIRLAIPQALVGAVMGELIASNRGIGYLIGFYSSQFNTSGVFAGIIILMIMAMILDAFASRLETWVLRWKRKSQ